MEEKTDHSEIKYTPYPGEAQLTARAVIAGCLTGSIVACTNISIGLKVGWSFGASIISAVLSYAIFAAANRHLTVLETNIAQSAGSAAGYMASSVGLLSAIPAMMMLGQEISTTTTIVWGLGVSYLGIFFAVPLRRQFVEIEKLKFPTGTATAETILSMVSEGSEAIAKSRALLWAAVAAGVLKLACHFVVPLENPPLEKWLGIGALATAATWGFRISLGPSLFGAGMLMGSRVVWSLLAGTIVGWAILGPFAQYQGWAPGTKIMSDLATGPRGWILWPGVAILVSESLMSLAMSWRTFAKVLTTRATLGDSSNADPESIPNSWWITGLAISSLWTILAAHFMLDIPWYLTIVAIPLSALLATVGVRSTGETDVNPVGGLGKVTQLAFGALAPGQLTTNLMSAAITSGGASQAADMMQDLKTGYLLQASPRKLMISQLFGVLAGIVFIVPVFKLLVWAWGLGSEKLPAPAGIAWKAMAEVMVQGLGALPPHTPKVALVAALFGASLPWLRRISKVKPFVPSGLAFGIAFIVPPENSLMMFGGLLAYYIWRLINPKASEKLSFAVASGFIAGEGLMSIVNAILTIANIEPWVK